MPIFVSRKAPQSAPLKSGEVKRIATKMLAKLSLEGSELSVLLCNDALIRKLNREHREKDKPTDVLSFPQAEFNAPEEVAPGHNLVMLGDVVISVDTALRQAKGRGRPLLEEVRFLLAHGLLHLVGYDHLTPEQKAVMTRRTKQLVRAAPLER